LKLSLKSNYVKTTLLFVLMIGSVFAFWYGLKAVLKSEHPLLAVASGSMEPTLKYGDLVLVQGGLNACEIKAAPKPEGDIIVFRNPNDLSSLAIQRAIASVSWEGTFYFATRGDNTNGTVLQSVSETDVVGRVIGKVPLLGHILLFAQTFEETLVIIIPIIIFTLFTLMGRRFLLRKNKP